MRGNCKIFKFFIENSYLTIYKAAYQFVTSDKRKLL